MEFKRFNLWRSHENCGKTPDAAKGTRGMFEAIEQEKGLISHGAMNKTVVAIVLDLSRPWTIKSSLEQWLSALEGQLLEQMNQLTPEGRNELYTALKQHILAYEDPVRSEELKTRERVLSVFYFWFVWECTC